MGACRQVPLSETIEAARYLANLFSCDVNSLPTALLIHLYWKIMPKHFDLDLAFDLDLDLGLELNADLDFDSILIRYGL